MKHFTDDEMTAQLADAKEYTVVVLRSGPNAGSDDEPQIVWEHGRRNFGLRDSGALAIVLPVFDDPEMCGFAVFTTTADQTASIMAQDPGVVAGIFTYDLYTSRSFPGDALT
jgi:hypothetical protein